MWGCRVEPGRSPWHLDSTSNSNDEGPSQSDSQTWRLMETSFSGVYVCFYWQWRLWIERSLATCSGYLLQPCGCRMHFINSDVINSKTYHNLLLIKKTYYNRKTKIICDYRNIKHIMLYNYQSMYQFVSAQHPFLRTVFNKWSWLKSPFTPVSAFSFYPSSHMLQSSGFLFHWRFSLVITTSFSYLIFHCYLRGLIL